MGEVDNNDGASQSEEVGIRSNWVVIAEAENRTVAEFAVNGLRSYDIPAVLDASPGALGTAGLILRSIRTGKVEMFKIKVPLDYQEEASEVVKIFLGGGSENEEDNNLENGES